MFEWTANLINHPGVPWGVSALIVFWGLLALIRFRILAARGRQGVTDATAAVAAYTSPVALARHLENLDALLSHNPTVALAWRSYRATLFFSEKKQTLRSSTTAEKHFTLESLGYPLSELKSFQAIPSYLANAGLVFTFASLLIAVHISASTILPEGNNPSLSALQTLFQVASFKFLTSIAGIISSVLLAAVIRKHFHLLEQHTIELGRTIGRWVEEVPRETMVLEHLARSNIETGSDQTLREQFPDLAAAMTAQLSVELEERLGGMIRHTTRQWYDEARREHARQQQTQESLLAELRDDMRRDLAEVRDLAGSETQAIKRSVQQMEHLAGSLREKPAVGLQPFVDEILQAISRQGTELAERIGSPDLSAIVVESLQSLSRQHGAEAERILKKMMQDTLAQLRNPGFFAPVLEHIHREVEQATLEWDLSQALAPVLSAVKGDHDRVQATQAELKELAVHLKQSLAQPMFVEHLSQLIHAEAQRLLQTWQETMAPLAAHQVSPPHSESSMGPQLLEELQRLINETTIVEPIIRSVHEEIRRIGDTVKMQSSAAVQDLGTSLTALRQEVAALEEVLRDGQRQATPHVQVLQGMNEAIRRLEEAVVRPDAGVAALEHQIQTVMDEVFKWRISLPMPVSAADEGGGPALETSRLESILAALGDKLLRIQESVQQHIQTSPAPDSILEAIREQGQQIRQTLEQRPTSQWLQEILHQGLDGLSRDLSAALDVQGVAASIRREQDRNTQGLKDTLEEIQEVLTTPSSQSHDSQALLASFEASLTSVLQSFHQGNSDVGRLVEGMHEELKGRLGALEEDWRSGLAAMETRIPEADRMAEDFADLRREWQAETARLAQSMNEAMMVIRDELTRAAGDRRLALQEWLQELAGASNANPDLEPVLQTLRQHAAIIQEEVDRIQEVLRLEVQRGGESQRHSLEAVVEAFGQRLEQRLLPAVVQAVQNGQEGMVQRFDDLNQVLGQGEQGVTAALAELRHQVATNRLEPLLGAMRDGSERLTQGMEEVNRQLRETQAQTQASLEGIQQGIDRGVNDLSLRVEEVARLTREAMPALAGLQTLLGEGNQELMEQLDAMNRWLQEEVARAVTAQHATLVQLLDATPGHSETGLSTELLQATLDQMSGDLHHRMATMMELLRQETEQLGTARQYLLEMAAGHSTPPPPVLATNPSSEWKVALEDSTASLSRQMENMLEIIRQQSDTILTGYEQLLGLWGQDRHDPGNEAAMMVAMKEAMESEHARVMTYLDGLRQAAVEEVRSIADRHLEALGTAMRETWAGNDRSVELEGIRETLERHTEVQRQDQQRFDGITQALLQAQETQTQQIEESWNRSARELTMPILQSVEIHSRYLEEKFDHLLQDHNLQLLESVETRIIDATIRVDHAVQGVATSMQQVVARESEHLAQQVGQAMQNGHEPVRQALESQMVRVLEQVENLSRTGHQPVMTALETQSGRIVEHVYRSVQGLSQPVLQAVETQAGRVVEHLYRSLQTAAQPVLQAVETESGRIVEQLQRITQSANQPVLQSMAAHSERMVEQLRQTVHDAAQPVVTAIESQEVRLRNHVNESIQGVTAPMVQAVEAQVGRTVEYLGPAIHSVAQPVLQALASQSERLTQGLEGSINQAIRIVTEAVVAEREREMRHVDQSLQDVAQPLLQAVQTQAERIVEQLGRSIHDAAQPVVQVVELRSERLQHQVDAASGHVLQSLTQAVVAHTEQLQRHLDQSIDRAVPPVLQAVENQGKQVVEQIHLAIPKASQSLLQAMEAQTEQVTRHVDHATQPVMPALVRQTDRLMQHADESFLKAVQPILQAVEGRAGEVLGQLEQSVHQAIPKASQSLLQAMEAQTEQVTRHVDHATQPVMQALVRQTDRLMQHADESFLKAVQPILQAVEGRAGELLGQLEQTVVDVSQPLTEMIARQTEQWMQHVDSSFHDAVQPVLQAVGMQSEQVVERLGTEIREAGRSLRTVVESQATHIVQRGGDGLAAATQSIGQSLHEQAEGFARQVDLTVQQVNRIREALLEETRTLHKDHLEAIRGNIHDSIERRESVFTLDPALEAIHHHAEQQKHRINELETLIRRQRVEETEARREDMRRIVRTAMEALVRRDELQQALAVLKDQNGLLTRKQTDLVIAIQDESEQLFDRLQEVLAQMQRELLQATDQEELSRRWLITIREETKTLEDLVYSQRAAKREAGLRLDGQGGIHPLSKNMWDQLSSRKSSLGPPRPRSGEDREISPIVPMIVVAETKEADGTQVPKAMEQGRVETSGQPLSGDEEGRSPVEPADEFSSGEESPPQPAEEPLPIGSLPPVVTAAGVDAAAAPVTPWQVISALQGKPPKGTGASGSSPGPVEAIPWSTAGQTSAGTASASWAELVGPVRKRKSPFAQGPEEIAVSEPDGAPTVWKGPVKLAADVGTEPGAEPQSSADSLIHVVTETAIPLGEQRLPWVPHRQKHQDFAGRREAAMNGVVNRMARNIHERTQGSDEAITPILNRMSDLLASGRRLSDPQFANHLTNLVATMEFWVSDPTMANSPLINLDEDILELAGLIQEGVDETFRSDSSPATTPAPLQRRGIKPIVPRQSPFPAEVLAAATPLLSRHVREGSQPGQVYPERLDSLLHQYYARGKGKTTGQT
ncbi:MAG: hypothetical protein HQL73_01580 [Magnetococcales bacterium]|nr:hypothetical protein [Magnetococcales bacterium]